MVGKPIRCHHIRRDIGVSRPTCQGPYEHEDLRWYRLPFSRFFLKVAAALSLSVTLCVYGIFIKEIWTCPNPSDNQIDHTVSGCVKVTRKGLDSGFINLTWHEGEMSWNQLCIQPVPYLRKCSSDTHILILLLYMLLDADVMLARRIKRDTNEKDRDIKTVLDQVHLALSYVFWSEITSRPFAVYFVLLLNPIKQY